MSIKLGLSDAQRLLLALIVIGLVLFGLMEGLSEILKQYNRHIPHFVEALWKMAYEALILTGALGLAVDGFLKKELIRDVGAFIAGWSLPKEIGDKIREAMRATIVRRNMKVSYRLVREGNAILAHVDESWEVWNYGTKPEEYESIMVCDFHESPVDNEMRCIITVLGESPTYYDAAEFKKAGYPIQGRGVLTWKTNKVLLPTHDPSDQNRKPACTVQWHRTMRLPDNYTDRIVFAGPTIGITVVCAECPNDLVILCDHDDPKSDQARQWAHPSAFMDGQALSVRWWPKNDKKLDEKKQTEQTEQTKYESSIPQETDRSRPVAEGH